MSSYIYRKIIKKSINVIDRVSKETHYKSHSNQKIERRIENGNILECGHFVPLCHTKLNSVGDVSCFECDQKAIEKLKKEL
tara:strand:+ start:2055 stop:2297 length:243 start_codon:yes stop_codon:yes gene_type:complete